MDARIVMDGPGNSDDLIINLLCGVFSCAKKKLSLSILIFAYAGNHQRAYERGNEGCQGSGYFA